jgi:hypothetical protein
MGCFLCNGEPEQELQVMIINMFIYLFKGSSLLAANFNRFCWLRLFQHQAACFT